MKTQIEFTVKGAPIKATLRESGEWELGETIIPQCEGGFTYISIYEEDGEILVENKHGRITDRIQLPEREWWTDCPLKLEAAMKEYPTLKKELCTKCVEHYIDTSARGREKGWAFNTPIDLLEFGLEYINPYGNQDQMYNYTYIYD